jgi:hypothetical protein
LRNGYANGTIGWHYEYFLLPKEILSKIPPVENWQPIELSTEQLAVLAHLINYENSGKPKGMDLLIVQKLMSHFLAFPGQV